MISHPVRNDFREFSGIAKFPGMPGFPKKSRKISVRPKFPGNSWEFSGSPLAVFNTFSVIPENSRELTEMCEHQIIARSKEGVLKISRKIPGIT